MIIKLKSVRFDKDIKPPGYSDLTLEWSPRRFPNLELVLDRGLNTVIATYEDHKVFVPIYRVVSYEALEDDTPTSPDMTTVVADKAGFYPKKK